MHKEKRSREYDSSESNKKKKRRHEEDDLTEPIRRLNERVRRSEINEPTRSSPVMGGLFGTGRPPDEDEEEEGDRAPRAVEEEDLDEVVEVSVKHPMDQDIDRILGPRTLADRTCYLCHKVDFSDTDKMSEKVVELRAIIARERKRCSDVLAIALKVRRKFEEEIRTPVNARVSLAGGGEAIGEWTLRSVYEHIRDHDHSLEAMVDRATTDIIMLCSQLRDEEIYKAKADSEHVHVESKTSRIMLAAHRQLSVYFRLMAQLRSSEEPTPQHSATSTTSKRPTASRIPQGSAASISAVAAGAKSTGGLNHSDTTRPTWRT